MVYGSMSKIKVSENLPDIEQDTSGNMSVNQENRLLPVFIRLLDQDFIENITVIL